MWCSSALHVTSASHGILKHQHMSSILCVPGLCSDCVASTGLLQGLCPRGAVSNYAKTVGVTVPQLNEEGDVIEMESHNWGSKTKVYWKLLAFHGSCISVFGEEGGHGLGRQDSEFRVALLFSSPASALHHREQFIRTSACSAPSCMGGSLHP